MLRGLVVGWAALAVVLTGATQLRPEAVPVGPGELLLSGWILFVIFLLLRGVHFSNDRVFGLLVAYWLASGALLGFGALMALQMSVFNPRQALREGIAFSFASVFSCLIAIRLLDDGYGSYHAHLARLTFFMMASCCTLLLVMAMAAPGLGPISFWSGYRFQGWAENPNQMALFMLGMPFLGGYLLRRSRHLPRKAAYALAIGGCVWAGWATASDGLRLAWAVALGGGVLGVWYRAVLRSRGVVMYLSHLVVPILVVSLVLAFGDELMTWAERTAQATYEEQDQGNTRITLWRHGIEAIAYSPLVGLGPGPHSGVHRPFEGDEAHNTFIDWGGSTGAVGLALYLGLLIWTCRRAIEAKAFALLGMVVALVVFSMFSYTLRHPLHWLLLVLSLMLAKEQQGHAEARRWMLTPAPAAGPALRPRR